LKWRTKKRPNLNINNYPFISQENQMGIRQSRKYIGQYLHQGSLKNSARVLRINYDVHLTWNPRKLVRCLSSQSPLFLLILTIVSQPYIYTYIYIYIYRRPRRNGQNFGIVFFMLKYTDITQNTYNQSWTVTEIMTREVWNFDSCYTLTDYQTHIKTGRNMWFL